MRTYIHEMAKRKDLLIYLVMSGLKADNRDSYLGYFWWLLDPLLNVLVYYFLVVVIMGRGGPDFPVFLVIGMVVWRWMSTVINSSTKSITKYASIINQVYLPKSLFPVALTLTQMFNFIFGLVVVAIFLIAFGVVPTWRLVLLPLIIVIQLLFLVGISLMFGYISVFVRDIDNLTKHIVRILFYASPIIWEESRFPIPDGLEWLVNLNPIAVILGAYRDILMYHVNPNFLSLFIIGILSFFFILIMLRHYYKNEHKIIKAL
ncbi:lipopolysaccharide transport system permease protein/teichoic acid transport system permease protein [Pelagirhabdus alkalitolerans]|uniref:Transport permease protein n=1 Tax=Pelagirhabdus alkalitolerans TaxID=1612202 RepID=A0A1G6GJC0_9BACI|nr:ABC transporter permease [Pelagirhabdus alkalitolerans]SDB81286.1 lipopolysaccharide transport system permease protein/teichoic acid transport system permease protein [Pelagirhabdus alkalitolerans]